MTEANEPEGCVLAWNRGPVGSHVENRVDLNWNKMIHEDETTQLSWGRKRGWAGGEGHGSVQTGTCWGWVGHQGESYRSFRLSRLWPPTAEAPFICAPV